MKVISRYNITKIVLSRADSGTQSDDVQFTAAYDTTGRISFFLASLMSHILRYKTPTWKFSNLRWKLYIYILGKYHNMVSNLRYHKHSNFMRKQTKFVTLIGDLWRYLLMIADFIRGLIP